MKVVCLSLLCLVLVAIVSGAPQKKEPSSASPASGSPFISSFDEIVVESNLRVKGKSPSDRLGRTKLVVTPGVSSSTSATLDKNKA